MISGRERTDSFLRGQASGRAPFMPFIDELAARVEATSYAAMRADPSVWTGALIKTAQLIGADTVLTGFDPATVAAFCGGDENGSVAATETLTRVVATAGASMGTGAALTGPLTTAVRIFAGEDIAAALKRLKQAYGTLVERVLQARPDVVLFVEDLSNFGGAVPPDAARAYNTLNNLAAYFDVPTAIYVDGYDATRLEAVAPLKVDVRILGRAGDGTPPDLTCAIELADGALGAGIGVQLGSAVDARSQIEAVNAACARGDNLLVTSLGGVAPEIDLETLRALNDELGGAGT